MCNKWFARSLFLMHIRNFVCWYNYVYFIDMHVQKNQAQSGMTHNASSMAMVYPCMYVIPLNCITYVIIMQLPNQFRVHRIPQIDHRLLMISEPLLVKIYSMHMVYVRMYINFFCSMQCSISKLINK